MIRQPFSPKTYSSPLKNGAWETILSSWEAFFLGFFLRGYVSFREGILCRWDLMIHQNQIAMLGHFLRNKFPLHSPPHFFNIREAVVLTGRRCFHLLVVDNHWRYDDQVTISLAKITIIPKPAFIRHFADISPTPHRIKKHIPRPTKTLNILF